MEINAVFSAFLLLLAMAYFVAHWLKKGDIFNPGLIYTVINGSLFLVFAIGPYSYNVRFDQVYYYLYVAVIIAMASGIMLGEKTHSRKVVKEIKLKKAQLFVLSAVVLVLLSLSLIQSGILADLTLEDAARNRLTQTAVALQDQSGVSVVQYTMSKLTNSVTFIATSIFLAAVLAKKKYFYVIFWIVASTLLSIAANSRTQLITNFLILIVPFFVINREKIRQYASSRKQVFKLIKRRLKIILIIIPVLIGLFILMTNVRTNVRSEAAANSNKKHELLEQIYQAKPRSWFKNFSSTVPDTVYNPLAEVFLYSGGTIASGGIAARIAENKGWHTIGLRNFFIVHRVASQLKLDGGLSDAAREDWYRLSDLAIKEVGAVRTGWLGDPGNLMVDFGYVGATIAAGITGWIIGWIYASLTRSGPVVSSVVTSVLAIAMLLTPAVNLFGVRIESSICLFLLLCYYCANMRKPKPQQYYVYIPLDSPPPESIQE